MTPLMSRRQLVAGATLLAATPTLARRGDGAIVNPLIRNRADGQILRADGWYYFTGSVPEYDRVVLRRARSIAGLATAPEQVLWRHEEEGPRSGFIWAPEIHRIDGRWTIYVAAGPRAKGAEAYRIRTYALTCDGRDPMTGTWRVLGRFETPWDGFTLDSTVFTHRGTRYIAWAQSEPGIATNTNLYLAPMASPLTLAAKPARLSVPTLDWECRGYKVNEAPAVLIRHGRVFLTYSASATDANYCMGMLTARDTADLMDPAAWSKSSAPVLASSPEAIIWGPGHNSFTTDEHGRDMLVFHARDYERIQGNPLFDPNRHTRVQPIRYDADGVPRFMPPLPNGPVRANRR